VSQSTVKPTTNGQKKQTLIEDETEFQGVLSSTCPVIVRGTIDGEVSGPSLQVSASGSVSGKAKVEELRSEGTLSGTFEAERVELSGTVKDKTVIRARSLEVKLNPERGKLEVSFGECELEVGDAPSKEEAVREALEPRARAEPAAEPAAADAEGAPEPEAGDGKRRRARRESATPAPG
jgi:cytoskeletal protein CcmA (bactofilin family)